MLCNSSLHAYICISLFQIDVLLLFGTTPRVGPCVDWTLNSHHLRCPVVLPHSNVCSFYKDYLWELNLVILSFIGTIYVPNEQQYSVL